MVIVPKASAFAAKFSADVADLNTQISDLKLELVPIKDLKPNPKNARLHSEDQILRVAQSMMAFGNTHPIVIDEQNVIISGHARHEAAKRLKLPFLPAVRVGHLTPKQKRALALAENKLAELSSWDSELLAAELKELTASAAELNFDYAITGFDTDEIDQLVGSKDPPDKSDPADKLADDLFAESAVTRPTDLWLVGSHRLYCANALDPSSYRVLLQGGAADIVFADPPYNVPNAGHASTRDDVREFAMAHGELSPEQFTDFLRLVAAQIAANVRDGAVVYVCMDWRHLDNLSAATRPYLGPPKNMVVWTKTNGGMGTFYRSAHEHIAVYVAGKKAPTNNFKLGARGRFRTNVWSYAGFNTFRRDRDSTLSMHPTVKPVALVVDALRDCSRHGEIVLDPFGGSGTTLIAAERTGRLARLLEIDPLYCDVIVRRWQAFTGEKAHLAETKETFDEVQVRRGETDAAQGGEQ